MITDIVPNSDEQSLEEALEAFDEVLRKLADAAKLFGDQYAFKNFVAQSTSKINISLKMKKVYTGWVHLSNKDWLFSKKRILKDMNSKKNHTYIIQDSQILAAFCYEWMQQYDYIFNVISDFIHSSVIFDHWYLVTNHWF